MSSDFWTMMRIGENQFSGLRKVMLNIHLHKDQMYRTQTDVCQLCTAVKEGPDVFGVWVTELFRLAKNSKDSAVHKKCHEVWNIWNMINNQIEIRLWLPYDTPSANESSYRLDQKGGL